MVDFNLRRYAEHSALVGNYLQRKYAANEAVYRQEAIGGNTSSTVTTAAEEDGLQPAHLPQWFDATRKIQSRIQSTYLQCLLITGARRTELARVRWTDVNFSEKSIMMQNDETGIRTVPLTPYIEGHFVTLQNFKNKILQQAAKNRTKLDEKQQLAAQYVFTSFNNPTGHIEPPINTHSAALTNAGLPAISLSDIRRFFFNFCEWEGVPENIVEQITGVTAYKPMRQADDKTPFRTIKNWHDQVERRILLQAGIE